MEQVNLMVGRFQPFTNGHMKCVDYAWEKLKIPTVLAMINVKDEKVDEKHPFPSTLLLDIYNDIFEKNPRIAKVILVKNANIVEIGQMLYDEGFEVKSWSAGTDRIDSYKKMAEKYHDQAKLADDFEMLEIKRGNEDISATKARRALYDNDVKEFAKLTPLLSIKSRTKDNESFNKLRKQLLSVVEK